MTEPTLAPLSDDALQMLREAAVSEGESDIRRELALSNLPALLLRLDRAEEALAKIHEMTAKGRGAVPGALS